jgi:glycosyltransferase involved in cell wall biosynthesis
LSIPLTAPLDSEGRLLLKIVHISSSMIPSRQANSIQVMKMCQAFARNGHKVILLTVHRPELCEQGIDDVFRYYGVDRVFQIRKLWQPRFRGRNLIYGLLCGKEVLKIRPDIVYGRCLYGTCGAALFGYNVIYEMHMPRGTSKLSNYLLSYLFNTEKLQRLVVISDALRDMVKDRVKDEKIFVAHDGADPLPADKQSQANFDYLSTWNCDFKVGYVGHLYPGKGGELIVELARALPKVVFHIFGGHKEDIDRLGNISPDNVVHHGFIPHSEIPAILLSLDLLLLPPSDKVAPHGGTGDIGSFMSPLKMFEYMAAGKPIIASDLPVLGEVLKHEHNALLVPPGDIAHWKAALLRLMSDPDLRQRLGAQARDDLEKKYTWKARAQNVLVGI